MSTRVHIAGEATPRRVAWAVLTLAILLAGTASLPAAEGPPPPRRIVALAPSVTEILWSLGLADRVVGVGSFSVWPPEVADKPQVGGLFDPNLEAITRLEPDLAILLPSEKTAASALQFLGIEVLVVPAESVSDVAAAIVSIAARCGVEAQGEALLAEWRRGLALPTVPGEPEVLLVVGRAPGQVARLTAAGPGTFLDELLASLGARNAAATVSLPYPEISLEALVARPPDVILDLRGEELPAKTLETLTRDWRRLESLSPLAGICVQVLAGSHLLLPGPRLPLLLQDLRDALLACRGFD